MRIVPSLDVLEDGQTRRGLRREAVALEQFAFEGGEEALAHRSRRRRRPSPSRVERPSARTASRRRATCIARVQGVVATVPCWIKSRYSSRASAGVFQPSVLRGRLLSAAATAARSIEVCLAALIGVMDDVGRPALGERHVQRIEDELGPEVRGHRPADDTTPPRIEDGEIQEAGPGRDVGDVGHPEVVRARGGEVAVYEIGRGPCVPIPRRRGGALAAAHTRQAHGAHQPCDPLAADVHTEVRQLSMDAAFAVGPARAVVDRAELCTEGRIGGRACRGGTHGPRVAFPSFPYSSRR
jgi:hypothetical protein